MTKKQSKREKTFSVSQDFFEQFNPEAKRFGRIVLPLTGKLSELIPHEVAHAVIGHLGSVTSKEVEFSATTIGTLTAKISDAIGLNHAYPVDTQGHHG